MKSKNKIKDDNDDDETKYYKIPVLSYIVNNW